MIALNENLQAWDLGPAETAKDDNCFLGQCPRAMYRIARRTILIFFQEGDELKSVSKTVS